MGQRLKPMIEINPEDGEEIRKLREARGLSQRAVARKVGMGQQLYNKIERGLISRTSFLDDIRRVLEWEERNGVVRRQSLKHATATTLVMKTGQHPALKANWIPLYYCYEAEGEMRMENRVVGHLPPDGGEPEGTYGITVVTNFMFPRYRVGQKLKIDRYRPATPGAGVLLRADEGPDPYSKTLLCEFRYSDPKHWHYTYYGERDGDCVPAKDDKASRDEYPFCHVVHE